MSLLDVLRGGIKCRVHVLDYTHPDEEFSIERRVPRSVFQRYAFNGEVFASTPRQSIPSFILASSLVEKCTAFMPHHLWQKLASEYKSARNLNLQQALQSAIDTTDRIAKARGSSGFVMRNLTFNPDASPAALRAVRSAPVSLVR